MNLLSLGAGNMASALLGPIVKDFKSFSVYSPGASAKTFSDHFNASLVENISDYSIELDYLVLSFKPQKFEEAVDYFLTHSKSSLKNTMIVSMLAGTPLEVIADKFGTDNILRIMPNTPAKVGHGVTLFLGGSNADKDSLFKFKCALDKTGKVVEAQSEDQFDQWTAVSGSGPAYIFEFARIMESILIAQKMPKDRARAVISELFLGSSLMLQNSDVSIEQLRSNVTSKNGVTYEALEILKKMDFETIVSKAIEANVNRSIELKAAALKKDLE